MIHHRSAVARVLLAAALLVPAACTSSAGAPPAFTRPPTAPWLLTTPATPSTSAAPSGSPQARDAARRIRALTADLGSGGVSVGAVRLDTGASFRFGARGGMATGSVAKLYILETLLLQHQDNEVPLSDAERDTATAMIEYSDNASADQLYGAVGTVDGLNAMATRLGIHNTAPGTDYLWGFTETCASDYLALLRALAEPGPLSAASRRFALSLLGNIADDQRWGVSAAADPGTKTYLKNGWLPSDPDGGHWLVNSVGIVTVHGHRVLLAVLTQHGASLADGIDRVEQIARLAAGVVA